MYLGKVSRCGAGLTFGSEYVGCWESVVCGDALGWDLRV